MIITRGFASCPPAASPFKSLRDRVRIDLLDIDSAQQVWSNQQLDRYIGHAIIELSMAAPRLATASYTFSADPTREVDTDDVSGMSSFISIQAVEYPKGSYPRPLVRFSLWGSKLYLQIPKSPKEDEQLRVWFLKKHTVSESENTVPDHLEELICIGAAGYAALAWGVKATNLVTVGGRTMDRDYAAWGRQRLVFFRQELQRLGKEAVGTYKQFYREEA